MFQQPTIFYMFLYVFENLLINIITKKYTVNITSRLVLTIIMAILVFSGCDKKQVVNNSNSNSNQNYSILLHDDQLCISGQLKSNILSIIATNKGNSNIIVDKDFIFFVKLTAYDDKGQIIRFNHNNNVTFDQKNSRTFVLSPNKKIERVIDFNKSFVTLSSAEGTTLTKENVQPIIIVFEESLVLPADIIISKIKLEYCNEYEKWMVPFYLGVAPDSIKYYTKPSSILIYQSAPKI
ncbi:MAG: hypothetical protein LBP59_08105 [Planctomycetaceae bacterium]|jgi:hypothetical protein|nr:hypothetical protein [Planctomycetaceae bacterium]